MQCKNNKQETTDSLILIRSVVHTDNTNKQLLKLLSTAVHEKKILGCRINYNIIERRTFIGAQRIKILIIKTKKIELTGNTLIMVIANSMWIELRACNAINKILLLENSFRLCYALFAKGKESSGILGNDTVTI